MANSPYPVSFYFELSYMGENTGFQEVSGISKEMNIEEVGGGGENRFKYRLPTVVKNNNLVLKRAMVLPNSKLVAWCATIMDQGLSKAITPQDVMLKLFDAKGNTVKMWTFYNAYPIKYSISDLKSQANELVIENIELAFTYFNTMNPSKVKKYMS